jgi:hypothetical protein
MLRSWWVVVLVGLAGCPQVVPLPPDPNQCAEDSDCPDPEFYFCDTILSQCRPSCRTADQCNARPAEFAIAACDENPLGCWCDQGQCLVAQCSDDAQCGALACRNGVCVEPPALAAVARCAVWPEVVVMAPGSQTRFHVLAWDAAGAPVVIPTGASWAAMGPIIGPAQGHSVEFEAGTVPTALPTTVVRASFGTVSCEAKAQILAAALPGELMAAVVQEGSGLPVTSALVVLSGADGSVLQQTRTDTSGVARVTAVNATSTLSVFHPDHSYQTVANIPGAGRTIFFALQRNRMDRHGGNVGRFDLPPTSNWHLARVGLSSGDGSTLELTDEVEPTVPTNIQIGSAVNNPNTPVPMGTFMGFGAQAIKPTAVAFGASGACPDPMATASGTCNVQSAWVLSADPKLGDLPGFDIFNTGGTLNVSLMNTLKRLTDWSTFSSTVVRDLDVRLGPASLSSSGDPELLDETRFSQVPLSFRQVRMGFDVVARMPELPRHREEYLTQVITSGVVLMPGRGLIPLGVGVGTNEFGLDGRLDRRGTLMEGQLELRMAPPHHGLEGQQTAMLTQVFEPARGARKRASSTLVSPLPASLAFDPRAERPLDYSGQTFPAIPDGRFDYPSRRFAAAPLEGVSALKLTFTDRMQSQWHVFVDPAAPAFRLPLVPGTLRDRLFGTGNSMTGEGSQLKLKALRFEGTEGVQGFSAVIGQNAAARSLAALTGWSEVEARTQTIAFASTPAVLVDPKVLEVVVTGFEQGFRDESVRVTFEGGMNCPEVRVSSLPIRFTVRSECKGASVVIKAEVLSLGVPMNPPLETRFTTTIQ